MKRFAIILAALLRAAQAHACMTLTGVGSCGNSGPHPITGPSIVPFSSSYFTHGNTAFTTNIALKPNGGTVGALQFPTQVTNSMYIYGDFQVDASLNYSVGGGEYALGSSAGIGLVISSNGPGTPQWFAQRNLGGAVPGSQWWNAYGVDTFQTLSAPNATAPAGFNSGNFPFTATTNPCQISASSRNPSYVWTGQGGSFFVVDPGFNCGAAPTLTTANMAEIAGSGARQSTSSTTCAPASPIATEVTVTTNVGVAHGIAPGQSYKLQGFTPTGYNATYVALPATTATTLVGEAAGSPAGTCPVVVSAEGTALGGTATSFNPIAIPIVATNGFRNGPTGILSHNGQHVCGIVGEYGDDSNFPGAQFASFVDANGSPLTGAPAVVTSLNQANAFFTATITVAQPSLVVSAMTSFSITSASYVAASGSTPAKASFVFGAAPKFIAGTEFTVSGMTPAGYNQTYVADGATTQAGATVVGIPLTAPLGVPAASFASLAAGGTGAAVTVIMPGMNVFSLASGTVISPFIPGQTGTGGIGTYQLSATQTVNATPTAYFAYPAHYYSAVTGGTLTRRAASLLGDFWTLIGSNSTLSTSNQGWGGSVGNLSTVYGVFPMTSAGLPDSTQLAALCQKSQTIPTFAAAQTAAGNTTTIHSLYELNDPGTWADSSQGDFNGTLASNVLTVNSGAPTTAWPTGTIICGPGVAGSPLTCPTVTTPAIDASHYNLTGGGTVGPIAMKAGSFKPAVPLLNAQVNGYIDSVSGTPTLHVISPAGSSNSSNITMQVGNVLTGHVDNGTISTNGNILTLTAPATPASGVYTAVAIGTTVQGGTLASPVTITAMSPTVSNSSSTACGGVACTGLGGAGTYAIGGAAVNSGVSAGLFASGILPDVAQQIAIIGTPTGTVGGLLTDGGVHITGDPIKVAAGSTAVAGFTSTFTIAPTYYPSNVTYTGVQGTLSTIIPGQYLSPGTGVPLPFPVSVLGYGPNFKPSNGLSGDDYILSNSLNGNVGTSGAPVVINTSAIGDGGAIAPGPALIIKDSGAGVTFPVQIGTTTCTAYGSCSGGSGPVTLSGTYDTSKWTGGSPTAIQASFSFTPGGTPIAGCSACAWTNLSNYSATLKSGTVFDWSGKAINIPASAGGLPMFVSVRASNGAAYVTMPSYIKMGITTDIQGEGQVGAMWFTQSGNVLSYFKGFWGINNGFSYPPVSFLWAPGNADAEAGDRFAVASGTFWSEGASTFEQLLTNAFGGWPNYVTESTIRDGIGSTPKTLDGITETQTIALGDGTTTAWCSAAKFCPNVSVAGPLYMTGGVQTGATIVNATLNSSGVLSIPAGTQTTSTPNSTGLTTGALEPGFVLSGSGVTGSPTLSYCVTNCTFSAYIPVSGGSNSPSQTWQVTCSGACPTITSPSAMRADPASGPAPWPANNIQFNGLAQLTTFISGGFSSQLIKVGTFKVLKNGTAICSDTSVFAYNVQGGTCAGTGVSAWVNYATGDYQVTFTSAPLSTDVITASWTAIISADGNSSPLSNRPVGLGYFGDGTATGGVVSGAMSKSPGGSSLHIGGGDIGDDAQLTQMGYQRAGPGLSQTLGWLYGSKFPALLPGQTATTPVFTVSAWRGSGPQYFNYAAIGAQVQSDALYGQWGQDFATPSTFSGSIASGVLMLSGAATGTMWEGEVIDCVSVTGGCTVGSSGGIYITSLAGGTWGANGSTYNLAGASGVSSSGAMQNALYNPSGPAYYLGPLNDVPVQGSFLQSSGYAPHMAEGSFAGRRAGARLAAQVWGAFTSLANASDATLDRTKASATGCDAAALAAPCFDIGNTYAASASATMVSSSATITVTGGIVANARPFVVGQLLTCSGCTAGRFITSIDVPPSQSTTTGAGEVGQTFHITASGTMGVSATETLTAGCSGTSGTGSNCIDFAFKAGTTNGTFGTAWALATCGENNLNGAAPNYIIPGGVCQSNGIGSLVRTFRIGTGQLAWSFALGLVYDDGADPNNFASFTQSAAFTCNIVAAKVVQCVKGANYDATTHLLTGIGSWLTGQTYASYGDWALGTSRVGTLMGSPGGQPLPFNAGTGGTTGTSIVSGTGCTVVSGSIAPRLDITIVSGAIVNAYLTASGNNPNLPFGLGIGGGCTFTASGTGNTVSNLPVSPPDGGAGYGTWNTDSNMMGDLLYGNEGIPGNPLNPFFTNSMGGYWEPGLPVQPFGNFAGAQVSG
jgi:hypothetical protein